MPLPALFDVRKKSLPRGTILVLVSLAIAAILSDFPHNRPSLLIAVPTLTAMLGTADTVRCMRRSWNFYHAGVILLIYMDLMADFMLLFLLLYPYSHFLASAS